MQERRKARTAGEEQGREQQSSELSTAQHGAALGTVARLGTSGLCRATAAISPPEVPVRARAEPGLNQPPTGEHGLRTEPAAGGGWLQKSLFRVFISSEARAALLRNETQACQRLPRCEERSDGAGMLQRAGLGWVGTEHTPHTAPGSTGGWPDPSARKGRVNAGKAFPSAEEGSGKAER